jgi:hypothetical protein
MKKRDMLLLAFAAVVAGACNSGLPTSVNETIRQSTAGLPDIPAALVSGTSLEKVLSDGPYAGFDTYSYPGDSRMKAWSDAGKYDWVGYYLTAPCHKDASWMGKRDTIQKMGWGTAIVYVGQQAWGKNPKPSARVGAQDDCRATLMGAPRGKHDAADAIAKTRSEGFTAGSVIFLDVEHMDRIPQAMRDYYLAWTDAVLADGTYRPGFYVHTSNAAAIHADVAPVFARYNASEPSFWIAGGDDFSTKSHPSEVGHEFAAVWQGALDVVEKHNSVKLPIDVNVASLPSPSSEQFAAAE